MVYIDKYEERLRDEMDGPPRYSTATPENMYRPSRDISGLVAGAGGIIGTAVGSVVAAPVAAAGVVTGQPEQDKTVKTAAAGTALVFSTAANAVAKTATAPIAIFEKLRSANLNQQELKAAHGQEPGYQPFDCSRGAIAKGKVMCGVSPHQPYRFGDGLRYGLMGFWHS